MNILYDGVNYECCDNYSGADFTGSSLSDHAGMDGKVIYGSCFSQEVPDSHIFPDDMQGVLFLNCNLDNVFVPEGNFIRGGSRRRFKVQEDGYDWYVDENNQPTVMKSKPIVVSEE